MKKIGIVRFLGTNCDRDIWQAVEAVGLTPEWLWHSDRFDEKEYSAVVLPGGFSYGDYLRCGALASRSPVMKSVAIAAKKGKPVMGICNGFQILCESGLLPGVLVKNKRLRFIDDWVNLKVENKSQYFGGETSSARLPIAHGEGQFYAEEDTIKDLEDREQVWVRYNKNPNGSVNDIAGVMSGEKNVMGMMPHPERALYGWMGGSEGFGFFESLL